MAFAFEDHHIDYERPYLYPKQLAAIFDPRRYSIIEASTKAGKAQPLNSLVYTPTGPIRMGDVAVGDRVLTPAGSSRVIGVFPQGMREVLRVTFSDGQVVEADADHLWEVHGFKRGPVIATTEELQSWPAWKFKRAWVPEIAPTCFSSQPVPLDPYLVGVLIGDGGLTSESVMLSCADDEILASVALALPPGHALKHSSQYDWRISAGGNAAVLREDKTHIRGIIERLGLGGKGSHHKFVPKCYRYNSVDVRLAVLQGLFDTDGFVDKHGQPAIEQTSEELAKDITELVQSIGGSVLTRLRSMNGYRAKDGRFVACRPVYRQVVRMSDGEQLFRLTRKRLLCRPKRKTGHRMFRSIEFARHAETQCIKIDDPRALYLTDGMVPTHNTSGCIAWIVEQALNGRDGWNYWWVAPVSSQADIAFGRCRRSIPQEIATAHLTLKTITLVNGAVIWFKSGDKPDSLYGDDVHAAVVDEASRFKEDAWYAIRSTLTATEGPVRIIGNVKGRRNWFYNLARKAQMGDRVMGYHKIVAADAIAAGVISEEEVEDARLHMPEHVFRELYLAEPSDDEGNPFGLAAIQSCIAPLSAGAPTVWGWDLAKSVDWTVGIALDAKGAVCRFERFQMPWPETTERIRRLVGAVPALVDSTGVGDPVLESLQRVRESDQLKFGRNEHGRIKALGSRFEGYTFTSGSKQKLMEGLAVAIQSKAVTYPDGAIVLELNNFEFEYTRTGVRYGAPEGYTDDCVCALALAVIHRGHARQPMRLTQTTLSRALGVRAR
jgi:LAGLIDADG-like domain